MNRHALLATIGAVALVAGTALAAAAAREDRPVPLVAAGASTSADRAVESTTTTTAPTTTTAAPTTTTTTPAPAPTTTTKPVAVRPASAGPLRLRCTGDGIKSAGGDTGSWVYCEVKDVDDGAAFLTLTRDGETIARTDDPSSTGFKDRDVRPGATHSYQAHSFTADGRPLQRSEAIRVTVAGGEQTYDGGLVMRCAGSGAKDGAKPYTATIHCEWKGVPERAAELVLFRDGEWFASTDDTTITSYDDEEVTPGTTYAYQLHAYAADGTLLDSSDVVRATSGGTAEGA